MSFLWDGLGNSKKSTDSSFVVLSTVLPSLDVTGVPSEGRSELKAAEEYERVEIVLS